MNEEAWQALVTATVRAGEAAVDLRSRCVELLVHGDDLARSVGLPQPTPDPVAADEAISILVELCRDRAGDLAVLRALTGRETADPEALRAL